MSYVETTMNEFPEYSIQEDNMKKTKYSKRIQCTMVCGYMCFLVGMGGIVNGATNIGSGFLLLGAAFFVTGIVTSVRKRKHRLAEWV